MSTKYVLYKSWIDAIKTDGINLSKWEEDFVDSLEEQIESRKGREEPLSEKQAEILERIYAEKTK